jgi:hypothetical protein
LDAIWRYAFEQAVTRDLRRQDELFFPASLDDPPRYVSA